MFIQKSPALLNTICQLAKVRDANAIHQLLTTSHVCIDVAIHGSTAIAILAQEGDEHAVEFLMNQFEASGNNAILGFARGGHVATVNFLITNGAGRAFALLGYAQGKHIEAVNELLAAGADRGDAVCGYALGGHRAEVDALLETGDDRDIAVLGYAQGQHSAEVNRLLEAGVDRDMAVLGYAKGGHNAEVNALLAAGARRDIAVLGYAKGGHIVKVNELIAAEANYEAAVNGYIGGGHIQIKTILSLLVSTDDSILRQRLAEKMQEIAFSPELTDLFAEATRIRYFMQAHELSFMSAIRVRDFMQAHGLSINQVVAFLKPENRIWFIQSTQLAESLGRDNLLNITSSLTGLSIHEAYKMSENPFQFFCMRLNKQRQSETAFSGMHSFECR